MYEFVDTIEMQEGALSLPAEAVQINGQWLENAVSGYRTLNVSGREIVDVKIQDTSYVTKNGSYFIGEKIEPRILKITYQLLADTASDYRNAFNQLLGILHSGELTIIFNDEDDKYFKGYLYSMEEPNAGSNKITGSFSIYCPDPLKYSIEETVVEVTPATSETVEINYAGTEKCYPKIEVDANSVLGWIKFNKGDKRLEFGDTSMEEIDIVSTSINKSMYPRINSDFVEGARFYYDYPTGFKESGHYAVPFVQTYLGHAATLDPSTIEFDSQKRYAGRSLTYELSNPAHDFEVSLVAKFELTAPNDVNNYYNCGFIQLNVYDANSESYIGAITLKTKYLVAPMAGIDPFQVTLSAINNTPRFIEVGGTKEKPALDKIICIKKMNNVMTLIYTDANGREASATITDDEFLNHYATHISICIGYYNNVPSAGVSGDACITIGASELDITVMDNVSGDHPTAILYGDKIIGECDSANVYVNGVLNDNYGHLENDWEDFSLEEGINEIGVSYLPDVDAEPTVKIRYKEAYL